MKFLIGLTISFLCIVISVFHLKQSFLTYYDFVGVFVVMGGTIAVGAMILPWHDRKSIQKALKWLFSFQNSSFKDIAHSSVELLTGKEPKKDKNELPDQILSEGYELISLGLSAEKIETILRERIYQSNLRLIAVSNAIRSLSKYPPAFGLVGTVLGLVSLMRAISAGASGDEAGLRMAIALVATLYGLLIANLIVAPAGEIIEKFIEKDEQVSDLALQAVLLAANKTSLLESQELINAYLNPGEKINLMGFAMADPSTEQGQEQAA